MKINQIRRGVFETNSSSTHAVSIGEITENLYYNQNIRPNENGEIIIELGRYYWKYNRYV